ncbi:transcriptional regulator [Paracoccus xiamenensis]|uniref:transcriptional regulator n=1 Tax=Paracoccus xiamenensis TaxID=2714901 RepID=UPI00140DD7E0|nr:transcriptional regulator [Paracoccus xiamenensis]NHF74194.1 transcriptional regulator [Paracoccus xiamenensis]
MKYSQEYMALMEQEAPHLIDHLRYLEVLSQESDRGRVLVTASMLDDVLTRLLQARLIEGTSSRDMLRGRNAPLGTFYAKITAAHALGLISDTWHAELNLLREIRNIFAHSIFSTFNDEKVFNRCNDLRLAVPEKATDANGALERYWMSASAMLVISLDALHEGRIGRIKQFPIA